MKLRPLLTTSVLMSLAGLAHAAGYVQQNLVSDGAASAAHSDGDLKNPWGLSFGSNTVFWAADNGTGLSTLYDGLGNKQGLVVTIPPVPGSSVGTLSNPTGTVFNSKGSNFSGDVFLFATEGGTIAGWKGGPSASIRVDNSGGSASYKGLAISGDRIYATDFHNGRVDVFQNNYAPVTPAGGFTDPNLPANYAPFNVEAIGNDIYVTYAVRGASGDDVPGAGNGIVDKFNQDGVLEQRLITGDKLNSPWGLAMAPKSFGELSGLLLVGNFGDGTINAFDPTTGKFVKTLTDKNGKDITIDGLWALAFGNGAHGFDQSNLYFTAGLNDEKDGLFGVIVVPEPHASALLAIGLLGLLALRRQAARGT